MGTSRSTTQDWNTYLNQTVRSKSSVGQVYASKNMPADLNPKNTFREARDSDVNPESTPIIVGLDVTGSMSDILDAMARTGLEVMATEIYKRKPVSDPQIMCMGVGDAFTDQAPLQITQFESDITLIDQLTKIWLEQGGGGNGSEGYMLTWYYAAFFTKTDAWEKRGKKGFLFTIGDDGPTPFITREQIKEIFGVDPEFEKITAEQLYKIVSEKYEVFHLSTTRSDCNSQANRAVVQWSEILGERSINLRDHSKMGEVITSLLQAFAGVDKKTIVDSWDGSTGLIVQEAIKGLTVDNGAELYTFN